MYENKPQKPHYKHLSSEERDKIAVLRAQGNSLNNIAKMINRNKSTISRDLKRNNSLTYDIYLPHKANQRAKCSDDFNSYQCTT